MPNATVEQRNRARKAAALTALVVCAFAGCFLALCVFLNNTAISKAEQEVQIADQNDAFQSPFYVLLIGSDTRRGTALYTGKATEHAQVNQHSDVMTIMRIDPNTYTVSLLTVPRDTVISEDGEKINNALLEDDPEEVVDGWYLKGLSDDPSYGVDYCTDANSTQVPFNANTMQCLCGNHEMHLDEVKTKSYVCDNYVAWKCIKDEGCTCGDAKCAKSQICIKPGLCSK